MERKKDMYYSSKRKDKAVTMTTASCVTCNGEAFHLEPQRLFQRLTSLTNELDEDISDVLSIEV